MGDDRAPGVKGSDPAGLVPSDVAPDTRSLLLALERHCEVRGSLWLYDALLRDNVAEVYAALAKVPAHADAPAIVEWLHVRGVDPDLSISGASPTPPPRAPDETLARVIAARDEAIRAANGYAGICVVLAAVAMLGWLAAFGVIPFRPEAPVSFPTPAPVPTPAPESP